MVLTTYLKVTASPKLSLLRELPLAVFWGAKFRQNTGKEKTKGIFCCNLPIFSGKKSTNFENKIILLGNYFTTFGPWFWFSSIINIYI
jgi:hypothetical protein